MIYEVLRKLFFIITRDFLSGCQLDVRRSLEDYNGVDAAKIRVLDKGVLSVVSYEQEGDCYKETETRKLTSAFHLSVLSSADYSTEFTKKINMQSPNSFGNKKVKEYAIRPDEHLIIINRTTDSDRYGNNINYEKSTRFIPEKNHEYEIYTEKPEIIKSAGNIIVNDVTTHESIKVWNDKICQKKGFFS
ncbi:hypothetical protein EH228_12210 [Erwinia endophytica]|uniref:hypothetical protein n=1 Tax=Erwinia endophytica TaxID=1563158 RepID=UPI001265E321|nr:hypothetical protein [Erwinia endophytica]KAB8310061.1 hypothetical protein EH228_12210 [Erwinia endophytica]